MVYANARFENRNLLSVVQPVTLASKGNKRCLRAMEMKWHCSYHEEVAKEASSMV